MTERLDVDALLRKHAGVIARVGQACFVSTSKNRGLIEALLARGISAPSVSKIIEAETGEHLGSSTLRRHVRRDCRCPKT